MKTRPVLRYHGGKWRLAPWIISHFPAHSIYVEPFCGAASVFLRKDPQAANNVLADADPEVVHYLETVRVNGVWLAAALGCTPYTPEVYRDAYLERGGRQRHPSRHAHGHQKLHGPRQR